MAKDGLYFVIPLFLLTVVLLVVWRYFSDAAPVKILTGLSGLVCLSVAFFFRDPERIIPTDENAIVAAADGRVVAVEPVREEGFLQGDGIQISIFLSLLDVHVNRIPLSGVVRFKRYTRGEFLLAFKAAASGQNEQMVIGIDNPGARIVVKQIVGFLARRIVCRIKEGDQVIRGQRFGLIRFGSRVEMIMPSNTQIQVQPGDRVQAGQTIVGVISL